MELEFSLIHVLLSVPLLVLLALKLLRQRVPASNNLPPSPPSLPIIGHLHHLKHPLHRTFANLADKYGPVLFLRLGSRPVVFVSSPQAAEECFTKNDIVLANRPTRTGGVGKYFHYEYTTVLASDYNDHWRNLRKLSAIEIFSTGRLNVMTGIRRDEIRRLIGKLAAAGSPGKFARVELGSKLAELNFNIMMRMVAGKRYFGDDAIDDDESREFRYIIKEVNKASDATDPADFFPILKWIGLGQMNKRMIGLANKQDAFLQGLIDEHRRKKIDGTEIKDTMIDHLLNLQASEPDYYSDQIIKGLIVAILLAGTDTSSVTLEWAMSCLVNHPDVLDKAKAEIDEHIGPDRLIEESDIMNLQYLQNIISETLRLKPAAPFLIPHRASEDCQIAGYHVPRDSMVMFNAWAIHNDPKLWDDPSGFKPERFDKGSNEAQNLIMPFGLGRRACPGAPLAQRVVGLTLGMLIQCFDWTRVGSDPVDLTEGRGITMPKAVPLEVMCRARPIINKSE